MLSTSLCSNIDSTFDQYQQLTATLLGSRSGNPMECPMSPAFLSLVSRLRSLQTREPQIHEVWLLCAPLMTQHSCNSCLPSADGIGSGMTDLQTDILSAALQVVESVHTLVRSSEVFIPPFFASAKALSAGCVLIIGSLKGWKGARNCTGALLQCSEVLSFTAPLWKGGREYYEIWRSLISVL